ncbi:serine hydrolase [Hymenobacter monticola]|uniref:Beta-lactamase n=1 Tax=Hymenobacter monticola TaxID=1705399 RepID=A0ABY4BB82_9BACT|nr:beta-lactamase family protein [Hymenobacter monticola]UOE36029.1 beta-lactamase family protein [Hymenobacter monticola]
MTVPSFSAIAGLFACLLQLPAAAQLRPSTAAATTPAALDAAVQRIGNAFMQQPARVGLSVGIIKDGQTQFYNFGTIEKGKSPAPTQNTAYEIGSISKTFGSLLLARAVVEKRVKLTDDVRQYLPGKYPNLAFAGQPVQLLHLANTTSGLPDNVPDRSADYQRANPDSIPFLMAEALKHYSKENFLEDLRQVKLTAAPGLAPRHSNAAAQLLGYVLENVYKRPFFELVATYINKPLRLQATAQGPLPVGYNEHGTPMPRYNVATMYASGGLQYSTADMTKYLQHQINETDAAVALTHRPAWGQPDEDAVGLNWVISKTVDSQRLLDHTGGTFGFASYCALYPGLKFGIVLLSNESDRGTQGSLRAMAEEVLEAAYGTPPALVALQAELQRRSYTEAAAAVAKVKQQHPELHLTEDYVNTWGYALARQGQPKQALELFKLNVSLHPKAWNTYDSLGETYELLGDRTLAIKNYQQSLALNPDNSGAVEHLKKLAAPAN